MQFVCTLRISRDLCKLVETGDPKKYMRKKTVKPVFLGGSQLILRGRKNMNSLQKTSFLKSQRMIRMISNLIKVLDISVEVSFNHALSSIVWIWPPHSNSGK